MLYIISADSASDPLIAAILKLGGRLLHSFCWLIQWSGSADSLALKLRPITNGRLVVCRAEEDFSYY
jgi:hypothetical protein